MGNVAKTKNLTEKQKDFARYYLQFDGDSGAGPKAYRLAYDASNMKPVSVSNAAAELMRNPGIASFIAERKAAADFRCDVTAAQVLDRWWRIATADPNEVVTHRRVCCRHCFGIGFAYQWQDAVEYGAAIQKELDAATIVKRPPVLPTCDGGFDYNHTLPPHPLCPKCRGEGYGDVMIADTRKLTGAARILYAGVKQTKNGIEVQLHDQAKALENIARHLNMFNDAGPGARNGNPNVSFHVVAGVSKEEAAGMYERLVGGV